MSPTFKPTTTALRESTHHPSQFELDDSATYEAAAAELFKEYVRYTVVFAKELAFHIEGRYKKYVEGGF